MEATTPTSAAAAAATEPLLISSPSALIRSPFLSYLFPLPEHHEISIPSPSSPPLTPSPSPPRTPSFKDRLIFGDPADPSPTTLVLQQPQPSPPLTPVPLLQQTESDPAWSTKPNLHRSRTAPAMSAIHDRRGGGGGHDGPPKSQAADPTAARPSIIRQSLLLLLLYLVLGVAVYSLFTSHFSGSSTHPVVDAVYFCIVTMCTIGYGDITPTTPFAKLFSVLFVLFGFGFLDILLSSMVSYVLDIQESLLLSSLKSPSSKRRNRYLVDVKKGRMRIRMKVGLALAVVFSCIGVGTAVLSFVENLGWLDSFYLAVMSVTTVGYGDRAFKTLLGRMFASIWLLVSTLAVARAFLYLAEARIDKRHRRIAKWVLARDMTVSEFLAADIDHNGFVR